MKKHPEYFQFKQFRIYHDQCALKVGTDGVLLGAWSKLPEKKDTGNTISVLDIGCGTGLVSIMLAQRYPFAIIKGIDIDYQAINQAKANAAISPWSDRISFEISDARTYRHSISPQKSYDAIVSNPPFYEEDMLPLSKREAIAKHTNTLPLDQLAKTASCLLKPEFGLFNVILPSAIFHRFISKAEQYGLYLTYITRVMTSPQRPCKRVLLCFKNSKKCPDHVTFNNMPLSGNRPHGRSKEYELLTQDFYL